MTRMQTLTAPAAVFSDIAAFTAQDNGRIPTGALYSARLLLLDLIGVAAAASRLPATHIAQRHAWQHWQPGPDAPAVAMLFDGRRVSMPGAAYALATQLDNLDAHDGWQPSKGHAGAALFPALQVFARSAAHYAPARDPISGREALTALTIGYEIAYRAALALHRTVDDYHTSGAWNTLGCVAIGARLFGLPAAIHRHAQGIAEYHAPRSQMMREIANPTMLHDGSGWGAPVAVHAVLLAMEGFSGAPAATLEFDDAAFAWQDLGSNWLTSQQYIKPYPVCRWVHAIIDAALHLRRMHSLDASDIESIAIETFRNSAKLNNRVPKSCPEAQYSLAWPVACALARGVVGVDEVLESGFGDPIVRDLLERTSVLIDEEYEQRFPQERVGRVRLQLTDGTVLDSGTTVASGGPDPQPTEEEVQRKYLQFTTPILGDHRTRRILEAVMQLDETTDFNELLDLLESPVGTI